MAKKNNPGKQWSAMGINGCESIRNDEKQRRQPAAEAVAELQLTQWVFQMGEAMCMYAIQFHCHLKLLALCSGNVKRFQW